MLYDFLECQPQNMLTFMLTLELVCANFTVIKGDVDSPKQFSAYLGSFTVHRMQRVCSFQKLWLPKVRLLHYWKAICNSEARKCA